MNTPDIPARISIEGRVMIMRKTYWSQRFAQIKDAIFSYKKDKSDTNVRQIIDLRKARISKGARSNGDPFFIIAIDNLAVSLRPDSIEEYKRWAAVLAESIKSDERYLQDKMAPIKV